MKRPSGSPEAWLGLLWTAGCLLAAARASCADPLDVWHWRSPLPQGQHLQAVCFGQDRFVAVGRAGTVISSVDGLHWTQTEAVTFQGLQGVAFGGGLFVAVGFNGALYTSPDGLGWVPRDSGSLNTLRGVVYADHQFVAVGENLLVATSPDGLTWQSRALGSVPLNDVAFGNGLFVAVGGLSSAFQSTTILLTSPDGQTWTVRNPRITGALYDIEFANGMFVVAGARGMLTSTDGIDWTPRGSYTVAVAYGNGTFLAVTPDNTLLASPDAVHWSPAPFSSQLVGRYPELNSIAFGRDRFVMVGDNGLTAVTSDGVSGLVQPPSPLWGLNKLISDEHGFLGTGVSYENDTQSGLAFWSVNGIDWARTVLDTNIYPWVVASGDGRQLILAEGNPDAGYLQSWVSVDGTNWSLAAATNIYERATDIAYGAGRFVALTDSLSILSSTDGTLWIVQPLEWPDVWYWRSISYGNGLFVALADSWPAGTMSAVSSNGLDWSFHLASSGAYYRKPIWGDGLFVALGPDDQLLASTNGVDWETRHTGYGIRLADIAFTAGHFACVSEEGAVISSTDAVDWSIHWPTGFLPLGLIAGAGETFIVVGEYDSLIQSDPLSDQPPAITRQPSSLTVIPGTSWSLAITATGTSPLIYQWTRNDSVISGATNSVLELIQISDSDAGVYRAMASNAFGSAISLPANVAVQPLSAWLRMGLPRPAPPLQGARGNIETGVPIEVHGPLGGRWQVQYRDSLAPEEDWIPLGTLQLWQSPSLLHDSNAGGSRFRVYRALHIQP